jgi:putative PIN family toxin of toxin-antitoxin system
MDRVVIDTNVFVAALMNAGGAPREVLRVALNGGILPCFGNALFTEYEGVLGRAELFARSHLSRLERDTLFDALLSVSEWVRISYLWRPNLPDEADNHVIELAVAAGAVCIITENKRDFARSELSFPDLRVQTAGEYLAWRRNP